MKINRKIVEDARNKAREFFVGASGCHDWSHVERVYNLAVKIAKKEGVDINVVKLAVYLHDIGRKEEMLSGGKVDHAARGAEIAEKILQEYNLDDKIKANILHCILSHRYRNNHNPETLEAKVLFDADKLDSIGAIGIGRDFLFAGNAGSSCLYTGNERRLARNGADLSYTHEDSALLEYYFKLRKVKAMIFTKTGKEIAEERHNFMVEFFKRFEKEIKGEL